MRKKWPDRGLCEKSVKHVYDDDEVMIAVESNADVEVMNKVSEGNMKKVTNYSDEAIKRPEVEQLVKYIVERKVDIQESIPHMTKGISEEGEKVPPVREEA